MSNETPVIWPQAIRDQVKEIEVNAGKSDDHTLETAKCLRELHRLIEAGAVGKVNWFNWVRDNVGLRKTRVSVLMRIAEAEDPRAEAVRQREMNARRQAKSRARQEWLSKLAPECRQVIKWARKARVSDARVVLRVIHTRSGLSISASIGRPPQQASAQ